MKEKSDASVQAEDLESQIGQYSSDENSKESNHAFVQKTLSTDGKAELYRGIQHYENRHWKRVLDFEKKRGNTDITEEDAKRDPHYFRKQLIALIAELDNSTENEFDGDTTLRAAVPKSASIKMEDLLGQNGAELYKLALEEERFSYEYMDAVFEKSITHFEGEKWAERPALLVIGPSGSGKSYAAKEVLKTATEVLPKVDGNFSGNNVMSVDGGIGREVSQMRKLALQLAENKGYTGIKGFERHNAILKKVKPRMLAAGIKTDDLGLAIPETCSNWKKVISLLKKLMRLPKTRIMTCRVVGEDPANFKEVVQSMGDARAWKKDNFNRKPLDLNAKTSAESKDYDSSGFFWGDFGSRQVEQWLTENARNPMIMTVLNDLCRLKQDPDTGEWAPAKKGEKDVVLISRRTFEQWKKLQDTPDEALEGDESSLKKLDLRAFNKRVIQQAVIKTSISVDLGKVCEKLRKRSVSAASKSLDAEAKGDKKTKERLKEKGQKLYALYTMVGDVNVMDKAQVDAVKKVIQLEIEAYPIREFKKNTTRQVLLRLMKVLDRSSDLLVDTKPKASIEDEARGSVDDSELRAVLLEFHDPSTEVTPAGRCLLETSRFDSRLHALKVLALNQRAQGNQEAYDAAKNLYNQIAAERNQFVKRPFNHSDKKSFCSKCTHLMKEASYGILGVINLFKKIYSNLDKALEYIKTGSTLGAQSQHDIKLKASLSDFKKAITPSRMDDEASVKFQKK